uniref:Polyprotein protein n=1 Tax=Solanum tuberosum TaxID=4113 RepID=M1DC98_SOLTU
MEAEFTREEIDRRRAAPTDTSPEVDVDALPVETPTHTPAFEPSAYSADVKDTRLERSVPEKIDSAILTTLAPIRNTIDELTARVTACESRQGETPEVSTLKAKIVKLKKDIAHLKATHFTALMRGADDKYIPETSGISPTTPGDVQKDDAGNAESDIETDEEQSATQTVPAETSTAAPVDLALLVCLRLLLRLRHATR